MSTEFQIIFTAIITLLAGLALFVLKGVYKKFEEVEESLKNIQSKNNDISERVVRVEAYFDIDKAKKYEHTK